MYRTNTQYFGNRKESTQIIPGEPAIKLGSERVELTFSETNNRRTPLYLHSLNQPANTKYFVFLIYEQH